MPLDANEPPSTHVPEQAPASLPSPPPPSWDPAPSPSAAPVFAEVSPPFQPATESGENPPWNGWDVVLFAVASVVSLFVALFFVSIVYVAMHGMTAAKAQQLDSDLRLVLPIQLFSYVVMVAVMYGTVRMLYGRPFLDAIVWNWSRIRMLAFVAAGVGLAIVAQLSEIVLRMPKDLPIQKAFSTTTG